ncbi:MAG: hypothetical protein ACLQNE_05715 [Thermoguttaceae bacterium]
MSSKRFIVPIMLALVLAAVAVTLRGKGRLPPTPDDAVNRLFQAAQRGDAPAYLATVTGELRSALESTQSQIGAEAFAASLRESAAGIKGFAVSPVGESTPDRDEVDVELGSSPTAMSVSGSSSSANAAAGWSRGSTRPTRSSRPSPTERPSSTPAIPRPSGLPKTEIRRE